MGPLTQLSDVVKRLASLDQEATIYAAEPWTSESAAVVAAEPESGAVPEPAGRKGLRTYPKIPHRRNAMMPNCR
jgi:hypothetical protein